MLKIFGPAIVSALSRASLRDPQFRRGRLGLLDPSQTGAGSPRIWFHAASVGEATGAVPTLRALSKRLPGAAIMLSSGTPQGLRFARGQLPDIPVFPFPLDFPASVSRALEIVRPDLFVAFETEFWPNFYNALAGRSIPALLLNGRVSESSARFYNRASPLFGPIFKQFELMAMHSEEDRDRMLSLGAPSERLLVTGSSKYEDLARKALPERASYWKSLFRIGEDTTVVLGGSLRKSECTELMRIFGDLRRLSPQLLGVFVPRHLERISRMADWLTERGIAFDLLTDLESGRVERSAPVVLVDRIGVLFELYSIGDLIFCGGTLEPIGGHNILEPAAWSKPVFYGPHLKKILHEHRILHNFSGSFPVRDIEDLRRQWRKWITDIEGLEKHGPRAKEALRLLGGVVERQVGLIVDILSKRKLLTGSDAKT